MWAHASKQVADLDQLGLVSVLQRNCKKISKLDNVPPGVSVIQHLFAFENEATAQALLVTPLVRKSFRQRHEATAILSLLAVHMHATCREVNKCLLKASRFVFSLCFCFGGPLK